MKYIILSFFSILCSLNIYAQETTDESLKIDAAFDAGREGQYFANIVVWLVH